jgi:hypothetical protein
MEVEDPGELDVALVSETEYDLNYRVMDGV